MVAGLSAYIFQLFMTMGLRRVRAAPAAATAYLTVVWGMAAGILVTTYSSVTTLKHSEHEAFVFALRSLSFWNAIDSDIAGDNPNRCSTRFRHCCRYSELW